MNETIIAWATHTCNLVHGCSKPAAVPPAGIEIFRQFDELREVCGEHPDNSERDLLNACGSVRARDFKHIDLQRKWTNPGTSPECIRCYAETLSVRRGQSCLARGLAAKGWTTKEWSEANEDDNVQIRPHKLKEIGNLKVLPVDLPPSQRNRIFICSMGDIFHKNVPIEYLVEAFRLFARHPHIYMLLTKRPDRAAEVAEALKAADLEWPEWVWMGTTCGHPTTKWRIEYLRRSAAKVRFVSMEPMTASMTDAAADAYLGRLTFQGIDQVIVGGESGTGYRPMKQEWVRDVRDLAERSGTAFFYKQDAAFRTETRPWLVEADGKLKQYYQYPGELTAPVDVSPSTAAKVSKELLPVLQ